MERETIKSMSDYFIRLAQIVGTQRVSRDYNADLQTSNNSFQRQEVIRAYYKEFEQEIISEARNGRWLDVYSLNLLDWFTPIEHNAWEDIRFTGAIFYPQYPVLNMFIDFANPLHKIGLEMDGKQFHKDKEKDRERDERLYKEGWKIFRISGMESFIINEEIGHEEYPNWNYLKNTSKGVIEAIKAIYFDDNFQLERYDNEENYQYYERIDQLNEYYRECRTTLENHKLADFSI